MFSIIARQKKRTGSGDCGCWEARGPSPLAGGKPREKSWRPAKKEILSSGGGGASAAPAGSGGMREALPAQYSYDVCDRKIFGTTWSARARSRRPPFAPAPGSDVGKTGNGNTSVGKKTDEVGWESRDGWAKR